MTPSQAKNAIGKALLEIADPSPAATEERTIRAHFQNKCAYCGCDIPPQGRTGHLDHLIPRQNGGTNHLSNLVLACNICNGDEKLDQDWRLFIQQKVTDPVLRNERTARIEQWITAQGGPVTLSSEILADVEQSKSDAIKAFDEAVKRLRDKRSNQRLQPTRLPKRQSRG